MKTIAHRIHRKASFKAAALLSATLFHYASPADAQYAWTNNTSGVKQWSTASNWSGSQLPNNPATGTVSFNNNSAGTSFTVQLSADQTLQQGLALQANTSNAGNLTFDLNSHKLILSGSSLLVNPNSTLNNASRTIFTFSNGTVQLGTTGTSSALIVGGNSQAGTASVSGTINFTSTATLDTANTSSIEIASNAVNQPINLVLNLTEASLVSGGTAGVLKVSDSILIGRSLTTSVSANRGKTGSLKLGVLSTLEIGNDLVLGQNARTNNVDTSAIGSLTFSTAPAQGAVNMKIGRDLKMGIGVGAEGSFTNTPETLNLSIGSESARGGVVQVGYRTLNQTGDVSGNLTAAGGTLNAHVTELRVGQNNYATGVASGVMDFRNSTLGTLNVSGSAIIGKGANAVGELRLKGGDASSDNLSVGESTSATRSLLSLNTTLWSVEKSLTVGAKGDISIELGPDAAGGIEILSSLAADFLILDGGVISITFNEMESLSPIWGLRMLGNQESLFQTYLTAEKILGLGAFGSQASIFSDGTYTYYGFDAVPEPSAVAMLLLAGVATVVVRYRKNRA